MLLFEIEGYKGAVVEVKDYSILVLQLEEETFLYTYMVFMDKFSSLEEVLAFIDAEEKEEGENLFTFVHEVEELGLEADCSVMDIALALSKLELEELAPGF